MDDHKPTPSAKSEQENMTWRPQNSIRGKVIGIAIHQNRILVCEVLNDQGILKGWCPLGGGIEFGELAEKALKREIAEEAGCEIVIDGSPIVCENIFDHHGFAGHEIVLAFPIKFKDPQIYTKTRFQIIESRGSKHWVEWIDIGKFQSGEAKLFPPSLVKQIF